MSLTKFIKDLLRKPEAIPTPGAIIYGATVTRVLRKPETKIASEIAEKVNDGTILDIGSGPGFLSTEIAWKSPGLQVCGIDLSRQMATIATRRARGAGNVQFVFGNAARLPFKDSSIALAVSTGVFHHLKSPRLVFEECYRVLKTGGEAWIYDGYPEVFRTRAGRKNLGQEYGFFVRHLGSTISAIHGFTREEYETDIRGMLEQTGFKGSYDIAPTDIWMKITLRKRQRPRLPSGSEGSANQPGGSR
jgi:ubiquinone/menaquinone biosynthesis C-methylase UbiE